MTSGRCLLSGGRAMPCHGRRSMKRRYAAELSLPFLGQLVQEIGKGAEFKRYLLQGRAQALYQVFNSQGVEFEFVRLGLW